MNDNEFEVLVQNAESVGADQIASHVSSVLGRDGQRLSEEQHVDLLYLEYLSRVSVGQPDVLANLCQRHPDYANKLKRQAEVDTELTRWDETTGIDPDHHLAADARRATADTLEQPSSIGDYTVVEKIGEGTQAEVFRVIHPMLRCELALKLAKQPSEHSDRILEEGRMLVTINDPGIARVIDAGICNDRPFIVSELVRGVTLKQRVDEGSLTRVQLVTLVAELARTVDKLHVAGIVHCDIKSTNVLVDAQGRPKLVDFGLAINRSVDAWDEAADGREDHAGGTLVYMAPELFHRDAESTSVPTRQPATDVFSLGALLYFGLIGKHPYASAKTSEIVTRVAAGDWDRQPLLDAGLPNVLVRLCEQSLSRDPKDRIQSAGQLADELQYWVDQQHSRPIPSATIVTASLVAAALLGWGLFHFAAGGNQVNPLPPNALLTVPPETQRLGQLDIKISDDQRMFDLVSRVPLESGEWVQIHAPLRAQHAGVLWLLSSEGNAEKLATFAAEGEPRWVRFPEEAGKVVPLSGPPGTEAIVWLESPSPLSDEVISDALVPRKAWPSIGDSAVFRVVDGKVIVEQRDRALGSPSDIESPAVIVQNHLLQATKRLAENGIEAEIIAFSHID